MPPSKLGGIRRTLRLDGNKASRYSSNKVEEGATDLTARAFSILEPGAGFMMQMVSVLYWVDRELEEKQ